MRSIVFAFALAFACALVADAANCTTDEQTTVDNVYSDLASNDACSALISDTGATSLDYCMKSSCLTALSDAADQLPDCTSADDESDYKTNLNAIVTYCSGVTEAMDASASAASSSTGSGGSGDTPASSAMGSAIGASVLVAQLTLIAVFLSGFL
ncbi:hypothetical protein BBJ28_00007179 [Nothophytophthora sp. Chile5]|nr:hypothetical protein BBJ28_00007179 [Nothophytophthora sp. Chile5]